MGIDHEISLSLKAPLNKENVKVILCRGKTLGLRYFETTAFCDPDLDIDSAANCIIYKNKDDVRGVTVKIGDALCDLIIIEYEGYLSVSLFPINRDTLWRKKHLLWGYNEDLDCYVDDYSVDFARYMRLLLCLCSDFKVMKAEAIYG
jgi:hypothetical protein